MPCGKSPREGSQGCSGIVLGRYLPCFVERWCPGVMGFEIVFSCYVILSICRYHIKTVYLSRCLKSYVRLVHAIITWTRGYTPRILQHSFLIDIKNPPMWSEVVYLHSENSCFSTPKMKTFFGKNNKAGKIPVSITNYLFNFFLSLINLPLISFKLWIYVL